MGPRMDSPCEDPFDETGPGVATTQTVQMELTQAEGFYKRCLLLGDG
jgi:hypothetical protein